MDAFLVFRFFCFYFFGVLSSFGRARGEKETRRKIKVCSGDLLSIESPEARERERERASPTRKMAGRSAGFTRNMGKEAGLPADFGMTGLAFGTGNVDAAV